MADCMLEYILEPNTQPLSNFGTLGLSAVELVIAMKTFPINTSTQFSPSCPASGESPLSIRKNFTARSGLQQTLHSHLQQRWKKGRRCTFPPHWGKGCGWPMPHIDWERCTHNEHMDTAWEDTKVEQLAVRKQTKSWTSAYSTQHKDQRFWLRGN